MENVHHTHLYLSKNQQSKYIFENHNSISKRKAIQVIFQFLKPSMQFLFFHPSVQLHVYDPLLFTHVPLFSQGLKSHSLTSTERK